MVHGNHRGSETARPSREITGHQVHKERREGGEGAADTRVRLLAREERISLGDHMRAGDDPKLFGRMNPHEPHGVLYITPIRPPRLLIADVRKPLDGRRHLGELVELGGCEHPRTLLDGQGLVVVFLSFVFRHAFTHDNLFYQE
jgi:hypothetical protein